MNKETTTDAEMKVSEVCKAVNESAGLQSLLYDLNLLPEQTTGNAAAWSKTLTVVNHWLRHQPPTIGVNCWGRAYDQTRALRGGLTLARDALVKAGDAKSADLVDMLLKNGVGQAVEISRAVVDAMDERERQRRVLGWTEAHDDEHDGGDLAMAGVSYGIAAADILNPYSQGDGGYSEKAPSCWPWEPAAWKLGAPRRMLVKAIALMVAEVERFDRKKAAADKIANDGGA